MRMQLRGGCVAPVAHTLHSLYSSCSEQNMEGVQVRRSVVRVVWVFTGTTDAWHCLYNVITHHGLVRIIEELLKSV